MSTLTFPQVVGLVRDEGPFYAAHSIIGGLLGDETNVVWLSRPVLTDPAMRWATAAEVPSALITLDAYVVAQLLAHDLSVDPDGLTGEEAAAIIDRELARVGCDMYRCCLEIYADEADHPNGSQRWDRCVLAAGRLLGVSL